METPTDLLLILERDAESLQRLRTIADHLGCDHIEADSLETLAAVLAMRNPTLAVLAVDAPEPDCLNVFRELSEYDARPATYLLGSLDTRVLSGARRAAQARGLKIIGAGPRPADIGAIEQILTTHLAGPPLIDRDEILQAFGDQSLTLLYQPKFDLRSGRTVIQGVEALLRWDHPRFGLLRPHQFLDAVERHDLMTGLTDFVLIEAIRQAGYWHERGLTLEMTVNLSPRLVRDRQFPERLAMLLREHDAAADRLVLDINEASIHDDRGLMLDVFTKLRILGVGLSLDNFGTGLSSLTDLYRMPFSEVKVDHALLADVPYEPEARLIVRAIAELAHTLGLLACAEGVETPEMLEVIRAARFDRAQGQLFSAPLQAAEVERLAASWASPVSATATVRKAREIA
jgi:EAL domain-containing protein (putative c-di-GMP-specific phosphodiesterase class I)